MSLKNSIILAWTELILDMSNLFKSKQAYKSHDLFCPFLMSFLYVYYLETRFCC